MALDKADIESVLFALSRISANSPNKPTFQNFSMDSSAQSTLSAENLRDSTQDLRNETTDQTRRTGIQPRYWASHVMLDESSDPYDTETNMKLMDKFYHANFKPFIKDEDNVVVIARHLYQMVKQHDLDRVANGLSWLMNGWRLESVAKLMKLVSRDWTPEALGGLCNLLFLGWDVDLVGHSVFEASTSHVKFTCDLRRSLHLLNQPPDNISRHAKNAFLKLIAILVAGEPAETAATFINTLTLASNWTIERTTELISFLDTILEWEEEYFREFTRSYIASQAKRESTDDTTNRSIFKTGLKTGKISFEYLAALYKTNLAMANYRLAVADYKMALANRNFDLVKRIQDSSSRTVSPVPVPSSLGMPASLGSGPSRRPHHEEQPSNSIGEVSEEPLLGTFRLEVPDEDPIEFSITPSQVQPPPNSDTTVQDLIPPHLTSNTSLAGQSVWSSESISNSLSQITLSQLQLQQQHQLQSQSTHTATLDDVSTSVPDGSHHPDAAPSPRQVSDTSTSEIRRDREHHLNSLGVLMQFYEWSRDQPPVPQDVASRDRSPLLVPRQLPHDVAVASNSPGTDVAKTHPQDPPSVTSDSTQSQSQSNHACSTAQTNQQ